MQPCAAPSNAGSDCSLGMFDEVALIVDEIDILADTHRDSSQSGWQRQRDMIASCRTFSVLLKGANPATRSLIICPGATAVNCGGAHA